MEYSVMDNLPLFDIASNKESAVAVWIDQSATKIK